MKNSVGTFRTDRLMQGDRPSQVTVNTGSTVVVYSSNTRTKLHILLSWSHLKIFVLLGCTFLREVNVGGNAKYMSNRIIGSG